MKTVKLVLLALFAAAASNLIAQTDQDLIQAIRESPEDTAALVEAAVSAAPDKISAIVHPLLATFPELAAEIMFGAIAGLPEPISEEVLSTFIEQAVIFRPGLASDITVGARRATTPPLQPLITAAVRSGLQVAIGEGDLGVIGRTSASSGAEIRVNTTLLISPSS